MTNTELFAKAKQAACRAYAPYSGFCVGAALLCEDGTVYLGANIENASYGATICAERTALCKAVFDGKRRFTALAVAAKTSDGTFVPAPPCGICRQALAEFTDGTLIVLFGTDESLTETTLSALLPHSFSL